MNNNKAFWERVEYWRVKYFGHLLPHYGRRCVIAALKAEGIIK